MARSSHPAHAKHFEEGIARANAGDWTAAEESFTKAIDSGRQTWEAYVSRGNVRQEQGQLDAAVDDFTRAVELAPDEPTPRFNRGNSRALAGELVGAIDDYTAVVEIDTMFSRAYERRGMVLQRTGQDAAAEADFSRTIELSPDRAEPYAHRAALRALRGAIEDALRDCRRALALTPPSGKQRDATTRLMKTLEKATEGGSAPPPPSSVRARPTFPPPSSKPLVEISNGKSTNGKSANAKGRGSPPSPPTSSAPRSPRLPGGDALAVVERLFRKQKASYIAESLGDNLGTVRFSAALNLDGVRDVVMELLSAESRVLLYLVVLGKPKNAQKREVVEFLTRANAGLVSGNYEYSFESNQVRFKTSLDFRGKKLSFVLSENLWLHAFEAHAAYRDSLAEVMRGKISARAAIASCE